MLRTKFGAITGAIMMAMFAMPAFAGDDSYNRVSIDADAMDKLVPDELQVSVTVRHTDRSSSSAQRNVNHGVEILMDRLEGHDNVIVATGRYNTSPRYNKDRTQIDAWDASQTVTLKSGDQNELMMLVSDLPDNVVLSDTQFIVSNGSGERAKARVTKAAIAKFQSKAYQVTDQMGFACYTVVNMNISDRGNHSPMYRSSKVMAMSADAPEFSGAPMVSAGEREVSVSVNGSIEMHNRMDSDGCVI